MKQSFFLRAASLFTVFCMLFCQDIPICAAKADINISSECRMTETGEYEVSLYLLSDQGICGIMCDMEYDEDSFLFLGGGSECALKLTYVDVGGGVRFILDGIENSKRECVLARFYFKRIGPRECRIKLSGVGEASAVYLSVTGHTVSAKAAFRGCSAVEDTSAAPSAELPEFKSFEIFERGGEWVLSFEVKGGNGNFAAGARLFLLDLEAGKTEDIRVVGVSDAEGIFKGEYILSGQRKIVISATALGYRREGEIRGERETAITHQSRQG